MQVGPAELCSGGAIQPGTQIASGTGGEADPLGGWGRRRGGAGTVPHRPARATDRANPKAALGPSEGGGASQVPPRSGVTPAPPRRKEAWGGGGGSPRRISSRATTAGLEPAA